MTPKQKKEAAQRIIEIKARMFDLMAHQDAVNKQVGQELQMLNTELAELLPKEEMHKD